jgi:Astacin (Peptidase family M12A)
MAYPIITCRPKSLPQEKLVAAAEDATSINPLNHPRLGIFTSAASSSIPIKEQIAFNTKKYWSTGGVDLTVGFLDTNDAALKARILSHMNAWGTRINARFVESSDHPQVRIARVAGDGYWSYIGTDINQIAADQPTMNLENFSMETPEEEYRRVVRHETGHTLGCEHEHLRRELVNKIDPDKAIAYFGAMDGWTPEMVRQQVLTPIEDGSIRGTAHADPNSIMCYQIPGSITKNHQPIVGGTDIDAQDYAFMSIIYPKIAAVA